MPTVREHLLAEQHWVAGGALLDGWGQNGLLRPEGKLLVPLEIPLDAPVSLKL